ncbi:hydroxyisourate hydrolase [Ramlibacter sp. MAHUQ-53]|uniref:hydroxyisourate hydrolase n=1 Tax=unclassified Ramlibacter TaxID=2617605 RepID=UPI00363DB3A0
MAGGISLHAVDVAAGVPAAGMRVRLLRLEAGSSRCIAEGALGAGGALDHPVTTGAGVEAGTYEAHFHLGDWWREREATQERFFQEVAVFRFEVLDVAQHYHLPVKFTRWGLALFRGA